MFASSKAFPGQFPNERVYIAIREHWVRLVLRLLLWLFLLTPLVLFKIFGPTYAPVLFIGEAAKITMLFELLYELLLVLVLFILWILYYLNLHVITDMRVVDIDQIGLLRHVLSELNIDKVEDVTSDTAGFLGNIFNYGNVYIQTAGTLERFKFGNVPNPSDIVKLILDLYEKEEAQDEHRPSRV